jgi:hypothetical protein
VSTALTFGSILFAVVAGTWSVIRWQRRQDARDTLITFAVANGWSYRPTDSTLLTRWFLPPFGRGERQQVRHVLQGQHRGREFVAFEYHYVQVSQDSKGRTRTRKFSYSILVVPMPGYLPTVTVTPESWIDRAMRSVSSDVELESEDFNRAYVVNGPARTASDLLSPRAMETLVAAPPFAWRTEGADLVSWDDGVLGPVELLERLHVLATLLDTSPTFLWPETPSARGSSAPSSGMPGSSL